jgi:hypothetical protein
MAVEPFVGSWSLFSVTWCCTQSVGPLRWGNSRTEGHNLHWRQQKQHKRTQTSMVFA